MSEDDYSGENFRVTIVHWINKGHEPPEGWRVELKCRICRGDLTAMGDWDKHEEQSLEIALKNLIPILKRPICNRCEEKIKRYKK